MSIAKFLPNINKNIDESKPYIKPDENSHLGLNVPEIIFEYGSIKSKIKRGEELEEYEMDWADEWNIKYEIPE